MSKETETHSTDEVRKHLSGWTTEVAPREAALLTPLISIMLGDTLSPEKGSR